MEIDSPPSQNQMEMNQVTMVPPEFYEAFNDVLHSPTAPHFLDNPNLSASSLSNFPTSSGSDNPISFTRLQDNVPRWRGSQSPQGQLSLANPTQKKNSMAAMREMIFRIAAMQPIHIDPESVKPPKRRNVKISKDPQSVAARHRRERISERIRILQRLVPGGTKMDTASMLDEAIHYVKFLKTQVQSLEKAAANRPVALGVGFPVAMCGDEVYPPAEKGYQIPAQNAEHFTGRRIE